ncbi:hypothetical protein EBR43_10930 [bacterium]|nr:hypothetical protein [bacterium]
MNFEKTVLRTIVEKLKLRRMRFKVDPAISNLEDFDGNTSYEGYVLNENDGVLNILVIDPNNQVRQTSVFSKGLNVLSDNLNEFKRNLVRIILKKVPEQVLEQIQNASTFDEAEQLAKQNGADDNDIKNAYRSFNTESTLNEQGLAQTARRAVQKAKDISTSAVSSIPGVQGSGPIRRALRKTGDIAKEVAFGKDAKTLGQKAAGAFGILGRVGETLKKTKTGGFQFKDRSSIYHKDKPRMGQKFNIEYNKDGKNHSINGTVGGEKTSGKNTYISLRNVRATPPIPDYAKISNILVDFDLNSPGANFHVYDDSNRLKDSFSGSLSYDPKTKLWIVGDTSEQVVQVKTGEGFAKEKQTGRAVVASQANIKSLAKNKGYKEFQEPYGKQRILFKINDEDVYFDSNFNQQTPKLKP